MAKHVCPFIVSYCLVHEKNTALVGVPVSDHRCSLLTRSNVSLCICGGDRVLYSHTVLSRL